ncbi:hypothetical protein ACWD3J_13865 [Streptomyces sp. NPDC002755]
MAGQEFQGAGGLRLHLDEPYSPQMADQIAKGQLVPVPASAEEGTAEAETQTPSGPAEDPKVQTGGDGDGPKRPNANSKVDEWRTYATSLGMPEEEATAATKVELQDWVKVAESGNGGSGD